LYNAGRVLTYSVLGALVGLIGASFSLFGVQQWLSILSGSAILLYLCQPEWRIFKMGHHRFRGLLGKLRAALSTLFNTRSYSSLFFIGVLNGLLPCGLVYTAIAASLTLGSVGNSAVFMGAFGLGTLPLMWSLAFFGSVVPRGMSLYIKKMYPYVMLLMGCMLIIRGLGLGIPYLSPGWHAAGNEALQQIDCHTGK
ncbi:MAG: sulfite exporter TauE/SafE family protein, partial [Chitinophagaceae bacterium]